MTAMDSTPVNGFSSTHSLALQLTQLEEQLNHLFACYQFYDQTMLAMADPEHSEQYAGQNGYLGLYLTQQWLKQQRLHAINDLQQIKHGLLVGAEHD